MQSVLLISPPSASAERLSTALADAGTAVQRHEPEAVLQRKQPWIQAPDLVLINARVDVDLARRLVASTTRLSGAQPAMVVFMDDDFAELEQHVRADADYIVPPYVPGQIRNRLITCRLRQVLGTTVEQGRPAEFLRYERELAIGREIQQGFLPDGLPKAPGWDLTASFRPAREVSGDFYDAFELLDGQRIVLVVADVCDKGVGAALFMALIRTLLRHTAVYLHTRGSSRMATSRSALREAERRRDEAVLLRAVTATNDYLMQNHVAQAYFATVFIAILDPASGSLVYVNCGHDAPLLRRSDGSVAQLTPTGPALGLLVEAVFRPARAHLRFGDLLFIYTDGVSEARDPYGGFFGQPRVSRLICDGAKDVFDLVECVEQELASHTGSAEQSDDITMLAVYRHPLTATNAPADT